ncbi:MAG: ELM1/GtrOC1 family putative glycosyltransferase [Verrucomicrobiota bacterium]
MKALWIKDGKAGHQNKVSGLFSALSDTVELDFTEYDLVWRFPFVRPVLRYLGRIGLSLPVRWFVKGLPDSGGVDLIVSAGGATLWPNVALARQTGIANVFLGSPRSVPLDAFVVVASHDPPSNELPCYKLEVIPSNVTFESARRAAEEAGFEPAQDWGILIGGDGEGVIWQEEDFLALANILIAQAKQAGVHIRVATSRRTPLAVEAKLRFLFEDSGICVGALWFHDRSSADHSLLSMMGGCERLFVTADSMSMTHEAVSSGRPVFSLLSGRGQVGKRLLGNLDTLEQSGYLVVQTLPGIEPATVPSGGWVSLRRNPTSKLTGLILEVVGLGHQGEE